MDFHIVSAATMEMWQNKGMRIWFPIHRPSSYPPQRFWELEQTQEGRRHRAKRENLEQTQEAGRHRAKREHFEIESKPKNREGIARSAIFKTRNSTGK